MALAVVATLGACGDGGSTSAVPPITGVAARRGMAVASDQGCTNCHSDNGRRSTGPTWAGLAGSEVTLDDGQKVPADTDYLTRAIVDPRSQVVAGFSNIMPASYADQLSRTQVGDLVAYLKALSPKGGS